MLWRDQHRPTETEKCPSPVRSLAYGPLRNLVALSAHQLCPLRRVFRSIEYSRAAGSRPLNHGAHHLQGLLHARLRAQPKTAERIAPTLQQESSDSAARARCTDARSYGTGSKTECLRLGCQPDPQAASASRNTFELDLVPFCEKLPFEK